MSEAATAPKQLTVTQVGASRMFGISDRTIRRWENDGRVKARKIGGVKLYPVKVLRELCGVNEDGSPAQE